MDDENVLKSVKYFHEIAQLRMLKRTGWWVAGVKDPETVAEHSHRTAIIAYFIGKMEGADACKCAMMSLFHDSAETRILDHHKIVARYIDGKAAEKKAWADQLDGLPEEIQEDLGPLIEEYEKYESKEAIIAKDADQIECAFTAKEYVELGYKVQDWIQNVSNKVQTDSAKKILKVMSEHGSHEWWDNLKKIIIEKRL